MGNQDRRSLAAIAPDVAIEITETMMVSVTRDHTTNEVTDITSTHLGEDFKPIVRTIRAKGNPNVGG